MTEGQVIDWIIKMAQNRSKLIMLTREEELIFKARLKTLTEIKAKLKRIDYYGGIESLIAKASIVGQKEDLFADNTAEIEKV